MINNTFNQRYLYIYRGDIKDLKIEAGEATGFESFSLEELLQLPEEGRGRFIPYIFLFATTELADFIKNL